MADEKKNDIRTFREEISLFLENEILLRYYFKKGVMENGFDHDPEILEATKVLKDQNRYGEILKKK